MKLPILPFSKIIITVINISKIRKVIPFILSFTTILSFHLCLSAQGVVKINTGGKLVIIGNANFVMMNAGLNNNGTSVPGSGTFIFLGDVDTSIAKITGDSSTVLYNVTVNKSAFGVALQAPVSIKNILKVVAGQMHADSNLTLLSDATLTARVDTVNTGAAITGKVNVQRYFPARRAWRLISAPVSNSGSIFKTWQNSGVYAAGKGMLISGNAGGTGFDKTGTSSLKTYNTATQRLDSVYNTSFPVSQGNTGNAANTGYFAFVRGDRNTNNFIVPNCNITTLTATGNLQTGNQTFTTSSISNAYTLIGNPYASPINFRLLSRNNLHNRIYVWDPALNIVGGYVLFDYNNITGTYTRSVSGSQQSIFMQSGQAFYVQTINNGASSLTITENCKTDTTNNGAFKPSQPAGEDNEISLKVNLYLRNNNGSFTVADGICVEFNAAYQPGVTNEDARKMTNVNENLGLLVNNVMLAIERHPLINENDTLRLQLWRTTTRNYQLEFDALLLNSGAGEAFCTDHYLGTRTPLLLKGFTTLNFSINADSASASINRFTVEFKPNQTLPVHLIEVTAAAKGTKIAIKWEVEKEEGLTKYIVEKSIEGIHFKAMAEIAVAHAGNTINSYTLMDYQPAEGYNFYRIKCIETNGKVLYSKVVKCAFATLKWMARVYPNPVKNNLLQLIFEGNCKGLYGLQIRNTEGMLVWSRTVNIANPGEITQFSLGKHLPKGHYHLTIEKENKEINTQNILIQ